MRRTKTAANPAKSLERQQLDSTIDKKFRHSIALRLGVAGMACAAGFHIGSLDKEHTPEALPYTELGVAAVATLGSMVERSKRLKSIQAESRRYAHIKLDHHRAEKGYRTSADLCYVERVGTSLNERMGDGYLAFMPTTVGWFATAYASSNLNHTMEHATTAHAAVGGGVAAFVLVMMSGIDVGIAHGLRNDVRRDLDCVDKDFAYNMTPVYDDQRPLAPVIDIITKKQVY